MKPKKVTFSPQVTVLLEDSSSSDRGVRPRIVFVGVGLGDEAEGDGQGDGSGEPGDADPEGQGLCTMAAGSPAPADPPITVMPIKRIVTVAKLIRAPLLFAPTPPVYQRSRSS